MLRSDEDKANEINNAFVDLNKDIDVTKANSRLWKVANRGIFGCDAEPRASRTSKMNMIMHGDGHGGIHYHDGLIDINGIFPGRFDIVLTNPPFGAEVKSDQIIGSSPENRVISDPDINLNYIKEFGDAYRQNHDRMLKAEENKETILSLYDIGKDSESQKTEVLFLERCLKLLKPGGRLGIVVPDGILNNPSLIRLRNYIDDRAKILAVISIPDKTFRSSKTSVKASLLFLQRLTQDEENERLRTYTLTYESAIKKLEPQINLLDKAVRLTWDQYSKKSKEPNNQDDSEVLGIYGLGLEQSSFQEIRNNTRIRIKNLSQSPKTDSRQAVKLKHDYYIFMAVAEHVGIRSSGKDDPLNELPAILSAWNNYLIDHDRVPYDFRCSVFKIKWSELDRWDPSSFKPIEWLLDPSLLLPLGSALRQRYEMVNREEYDFSELTPITIHFDGSIEPRDISDADDYTMELFFAHPGDIVVSKIDLKNGAVGIVPEDLKNVVVTNHFVVYEPLTDKLYPPYLIRLIQSNFFKDYLWRKKVGSEGRKEVKIYLFENTQIPLPDTKIQQSAVDTYVHLYKQKHEIENLIKLEKPKLDDVLLSGCQ